MASIEIQRTPDTMHAHDHGLEHDLRRLLASTQHRRRAMRWLAGAGAMALLGCGGSGDDAGTSSSGSTGSTGSTGGTGSGATTTCALIPEETAGPYPGDGSNTSGGSIANALALSGIVRSDIRTSVAGASGVAQGVPMTVIIDLVNTNASCAALADHAIYLWHCDAAGRYSMYSAGVTAENYLRGVQATGSDGTATFTTIVPGCYSGRMPHMHFEVYRSINVATQWTSKLRTSQIAFTPEFCGAVYNGSSLYTTSVANLARISFATDNVFSDGVTTQLATVTGDIASGYVARLQVGIAG